MDLMKTTANEKSDQTKEKSAEKVAATKEQISGQVNSQAKQTASKPTDKLASHSSALQATLQTQSQAPSIFSYLDYRAFLKDFYVYKKSSSTSFSFQMFSQKAGLQTKNYLKRVMEGERPLSGELIPKFCIGLGLAPKEKVYFEALECGEKSVQAFGLG